MVEVAKQQLLDKLHLKERPNITQAVPRAALLTALRKLHSGRVRQDGTLELENSLPSKDQGYEIVSFADISKFGGHPFFSFMKNLRFPKFAWRSQRKRKKDIDYRNHILELLLLLRGAVLMILFVQL